MAETGFLAGAASRLSGVAYRTLNYWSISDFLRASGREASGHGSKRLYTFADVVALRAACELRAAGVSLQALRRVQERLRRYKGLRNPLAEARLVVISGPRPDVVRVEIAEDAARLESLLANPGQTVTAPAVVLGLAPVVQDVLRRIDAEKQRKVSAARKAGGTGRVRTHATEPTETAVAASGAT